MKAVHPINEVTLHTLIFNKKHSEKSLKVVRPIKRGVTVVHGWTFAIFRILKFLNPYGIKLSCYETVFFPYFLKSEFPNLINSLVFATHSPTESRILLFFLISNHYLLVISTCANQDRRFANEEQQKEKKKNCDRAKQFMHKNKRNLR